MLSIGIGGSALGPMFVADALGGRPTEMPVDFIDNTDPDGIERMLDRLRGQAGETLCIVTSKSGGTPETRNGMLIVAEAYRRAARVPEHAVAITMPGSKLDQSADKRRVAGALPDVRLGGRSDQRDVGGGPAAGRLAGDRH